MVPLPGAIVRAAYAPTSACDGAIGRMGSPWCSQPGWKGGPVAPRRRWQQWRQQQRSRGLQQVGVICLCFFHRAERNCIVKCLDEGFAVLQLSQPCVTTTSAPRSLHSHVATLPCALLCPSQTQAALLDPPPFDPSKLRVEYLPGGREAALSAGPRRYTLTHNDVTGSLQLSIGALLPLPRSHGRSKGADDTVEARHGLLRQEGSSWSPCGRRACVPPHARNLQQHADNSCQPGLACLSCRPRVQPAAARRLVHSHGAGRDPGRVAGHRAAGSGAHLLRWRRAAPAAQPARVLPRQVRIAPDTVHCCVGRPGHCAPRAQQAGCRCFWPAPLRHCRSPAAPPVPPQLPIRRELSCPVPCCLVCACSGEELWPAPPQLRSFIFQREMTLVLDTIAHAEGCPGGLLAAAPALRLAPVYVHLRSDLPALDRVVEWGVLGDRATWRTAQSSVMRSLLSSVLGTMDEADATDGSNGSWSRSSFSSASASWDELGGRGPGGGAASGLDTLSSGAALVTPSSGGSSSSMEDEEEEHQPQQQQQQLPGAEQQQQLQKTVVNGVSSKPSQAASAVAVTAGAVASSSSTTRLAVNGGASSSSLGSVANGAVSLATAQQQSGERAASGWLAGDALPRMPAVKAAASRQR